MSQPRRHACRAAIVLAGFLAGGCASATVVSSPSPTSVIVPVLPSSVATAAPASTPAPSVAPHLLPNDSPVDVGTYILGPDALVGLPTMRITFTVPGAGWASWSPYGVSKDGGGSVAFGVLRVANLFADPCHRRRGELTPRVGPAVEDLARALATQPGVRATGPTDVTLGGFRGRFVELAVDPAIDFTACDDAFFSAGWISPDGDSVPVLAPDEVSRFWILDAYDTRLVVWATAFPGTSAKDRAELQQLVDSIRIGR